MHIYSAVPKEWDLFGTDNTKLQYSIKEKGFVRIKNKTSTLPFVPPSWNIESYRLVVWLGMGKFHYKIYKLRGSLYALVFI